MTIPAAVPPAADTFTTRPVIRGRRGVVTAGNYLASAAGFAILNAGGNAIDAAAAMTFVLNLVEPHNCGIGGECPVLIYVAKEKRVVALSGQGCAPAAMTQHWFRERGIDLIPGDGLLPAMVPAVVGTWAEAVARWGTMRFADILRPAIELARDGFSLYPDLHRALVRHAPRCRQRYPSTAAVYLDARGEPPPVGGLVRNPAWADTLQRMIDAEAAASGAGRIAGIEAARDAFYRGETAERIAGFAAAHRVIDATGRENHGFLTLDDLANWHAAVEEPATFTYRGYEVCKCPAWTQGPVFLQQLALLDGWDLPRLGHNTGDYLHTWIECAKLAFADREAYYGDPAFDDVPLETLLDSGYNAGRRRFVGEMASYEMRPGVIYTRHTEGREAPPPEGYLHDALNVAADAEYARTHANDTTHCDALDRWGNMVSATPSGGWIASSPVIPGLGFPLGTRGQMFYLNPARPNALLPGKRPRTTLTPSLALRDGEPYMAFGTPGGDQQDQWTLQFFLNVVEFGMDLQQAIDAPTVHTQHFPSSFYPRASEPGSLYADGRIPAAVLRDLSARGHDVKLSPPWTHGRVLAVRRLPDGGMEAAASAHAQMAYAMGW